MPPKVAKRFNKVHYLGRLYDLSHMFADWRDTYRAQAAAATRPVTRARFQARAEQCDEAFLLLDQVVRLVYFVV